MIWTRSKQLAALCATATVCIGATAHGGTQEETFTDSFTVPDIFGPAIIAMPQFDPQGGCRELLKVTMAAEGLGTGDYSFTNDSDTLCTGSVTIILSPIVTFPFPSGPPPILQCEQWETIGPLAILLNPGETLEVPINFQFSCMDMTEPGDDLTPFIGMGTIFARVDYDLTTDSEIDCDFTESLDTDLAGTFTLTYEYVGVQLECTIVGPDSLCPDDQNIEYEVITDPGLDVEWMIAGDAVFCEPPVGANALVCAENVCGSFTLTVAVSDPSFPGCPPSTCTKTVVLEDSDPPGLTCPPSPPVIGCNAPFTFSVEATDNCDNLTIDYGAVFNPPGSGTFVGHGDGTFTIEFAETGSAVVTFTATDSCGNTGVCVIEFTADCGEEGEGCTPGYWKQEHHFCNWAAPYEPDQMFSMWFDDAFEGRSLLTVLSQPASSDPGPIQLNSLGRHTVAALLNAASLDVAYDLGPAAVIEMFNEAYPGSKRDYNAAKAIFGGFNEQGCPLGNCNNHGNPADLDGDDEAGVTDFLILVGNWGASGAGDYNDSNVVDAADLLFLMQYWGT